MRLVARPTFRPQLCAATLKGPAGSPAERWVDTGLEMPGFDNHVYLCETAVVEAARLLGFPTQKALADLQRQLGEALVAKTDTERQLAEVRAALAPAVA